METDVLVVRDGETKEIPAEELVPGDIPVLKAGDTFGADARIIWTASAKVDMSSLTGKSVPVERTTEIRQVTADKAMNLVFKGSSIATGQCRAIDIRVGNKILIGTIMRLAGRAQVEEGELGKELAVLIRRIVLVAVTTASIFMGVAFIQGLSVVTAFEVGIGILVAFLPQGLPLTITILLTDAAKRMAEKNVLVKNLQAMETLGSLTVIATDKTGTLTQNLMKVTGGWVGRERIEELNGGDLKVFEKIVDCYCGSTQIDITSLMPEDLKNDAKIRGDATELGPRDYL